MTFNVHHVHIMAKQRSLKRTVFNHHYGVSADNFIFRLIFFVKDKNWRSKKI